MNSVRLNAKEDAATYQVSSVRKALEILCAFTTDKPRWSLSGLSRTLGLPKSTALNLVRTLQGFDLLRQDPEDKSYAIGPRAYEIGALFATGTEFVFCALPVMRKLNERTKETVKLGILSSGGVLVVAAVESPLQLHTRGDVGRRWRLHSSSLGKAILSALPQADVEEIVDTQGLPRFTASTITGKEEMFKALQKIRECGFALDLEENEPGVRCVSASITDPLKGLTGALSMSGPSIRLGKESLYTHARNVVAAAREIQAALRGTRKGLRVVDTTR